MVSRVLMSASAAIVLVVGALHLRALFFSPELRPRDLELEARMKEVSPVVTSLTTMWKAWVGFNAMQSVGLMLFGVVYAYLSLFRFQVLREDPFLLSAGAVFLGSLVVLARRYLFNIPERVFAVALVLYVLGAAVAVV